MWSGPHWNPYSFRFCDVLTTGEGLGRGPVLDEPKKIDANKGGHRPSLCFPLSTGLNCRRGRRTFFDGLYGFSPAHVFFAEPRGVFVASPSQWRSTSGVVGSATGFEKSASVPRTPPRSRLIKIFSRDLLPLDLVHEPNAVTGFLRATQLDHQLGREGVTILDVVLVNFLNFTFSTTGVRQFF